MEVFVDHTRCRGHALCISNAPEVFEFVDLEDRSMVRGQADPELHEEQVLAAARECPERAIVIQTGDRRGGGS